MGSPLPQRAVLVTVPRSPGLDRLPAPGINRSAPRMLALDDSGRRELKRYTGFLTGTDSHLPRGRDFLPIANDFGLQRVTEVHARGQLRRREDAGSGGRGRCVAVDGQRGLGRKADNQRRGGGRTGFLGPLAFLRRLRSGLCRSGWHRGAVHHAAGAAVVHATAAVAAAVVDNAGAAVVDATAAVAAAAAGIPGADRAIATVAAVAEQFAEQTVAAAAAGVAGAATIAATAAGVAGAATVPTEEPVAAAVAAVATEQTMSAAAATTTAEQAVPAEQLVPTAAAVADNHRTAAAITDITATTVVISGNARSPTHRHCQNHAVHFVHLLQITLGMQTQPRSDQLQARSRKPYQKNSWGKWSAEHTLSGTSPRRKTAGAANLMFWCVSMHTEITNEAE